MVKPCKAWRWVSHISLSLIVHWGDSEVSVHSWRLDSGDMGKSENHCQFSEKIIVLWVSSLLQEDLFQQPGLRPEFEHIRDCLDTGMIDNLCILQKFVCACENMRASKRERSISQSLGLIVWPWLTSFTYSEPSQRGHYDFTQSVWHLTNSMVPLRRGLAS